MKLSLVMILAAIFTFVIGLAFIVVPETAISVYGGELNLGGQFIARYLGAALIGMSFLAWMSRDVPPSQARQAILSALFVFNVLGLVVGIIDSFKNYGNALDLVNLVIFLFFAVCFAYFGFVKKEAQA